MAKHSEWHNRKHRKRKQDRKRAKKFAKLSRRIRVAAREGGGDPDENPTLRSAIEQARDADMPKENIERAIKKGTGELETQEPIEQRRYEGYTPGGAGVIVEAATENRNRTASQLRHIFDTHDGDMGEKGCVAYQFTQCGYFTLPDRYDEQTVFETTVEAGASDWSHEDGQYEIITPVKRWADVKQALTENGLEPETDEITFLPDTKVPLDESVQSRAMNLLEELDDHSDVQDVHTNAQFA